MYLPASSLQNLEVFASQSGQEKGTLFHALNMTRTLFGRRLLKRWLAQPLRSKRFAARDCPHIFRAVIG
jgi:DNA mismatch repair protein MSH3